MAAKKRGRKRKRAIETVEGWSPADLPDREPDDAEGLEVIVRLEEASSAAARGEKLAVIAELTLEALAVLRRLS